MNICLCAMTKELARRYYKGFVMDPALFADNNSFQDYEYSEERSDKTVERHRRLGRIFLAILLDGEPIGEIVLKNIDPKLKQCTLSISLQCDRYKNKGYGTAAEILTLEYVFDNLRMETVLADALLNNKRSQHVLVKVGFQETHRDELFVYYRYDRRNWTGSTHVDFC